MNSEDDAGGSTQNVDKEHQQGDQEVESRTPELKDFARSNTDAENPVLEKSNGAKVDEEQEIKAGENADILRETDQNSTVDVGIDPEMLGTMGDIISEANENDLDLKGNLSDPDKHVDTDEVDAKVGTDEGDVVRSVVNFDDSPHEGMDGEAELFEKMSAVPVVNSSNLEQQQDESQLNNNYAVYSGAGPLGGQSDDANKKNKTPAYFTDKKDSITVHLKTICGVRLEFHHVPRRYYASEIGVLVVRDTAMRPTSFKIYYKSSPLQPLVQVEKLADSDGVVNLTLKLNNVDEDAPKIHLGTRIITFKSGLSIKVIGRKISIGREPCSRANLLEVVLDRNGEEQPVIVDVHWLHPKHHKPFLGGYRHTLTDARYHHASAQTNPVPKPPYPVPHYSRDTQTYRMKHFGQSTVNHMSTQFPKPGFFVSNYQDKLMTPGVYETADEFLARILRQIIIIQKYTRRYLAKKYVAELRRKKEAFLAWEAEHEKQMKDDKEKRLKEDFERRLQPKRRSDFDRLFNALEQWRREEVGKIDAQDLSPAERKAALALLLEEETELIAAIGRHQLCASKKGQEQEQMNLLKKAAAPIRWFSSVNGRSLEVQTAKTQRAKELLDIFESLKMECLTIEERLDILLSLKHTVSKFSFRVCREISELVDREAELIIRGVPNEQLKGLRSRIANRFVKFAKMPEVNPEIANYLKVPTGPKEKVAESLKGDVHYCLSCDRYLRNTAFPLSARAIRLPPCESCRRQDNRARKRLDLTPYNWMLMELRKNELKLVQQAREHALENAKRLVLERLEAGEDPQIESVIKVDGTDPNVLNTNPYPFLVNKEDIQYLVDEVWERRSFLSGWLDINDLVLTRWRLNEPWSPWNTILVTREEAEAHAKLGNFSLEAAYADAMLNTVNQRLVMGRNAFARLYRNGIHMAYEQVETAQRMQTREETQDWLTERRGRLPPLVPFSQKETSSEERHRAIYQPPEYMLPAIRGEKKLSEVRPPEKSAKT
ncbi:unnamed protein product [Calicophoron daubneyi]|uniref:IQ motif and ubiquitin-like domain-containing protein n=1 Tax=Calicophoron daubneyi TaxID=300641 RepID=A0AAV2SZ83_CALDB